MIVIVALLVLLASPALADTFYIDDAHCAPAGYWAGETDINGWPLCSYPRSKKPTNYEHPPLTIRECERFSSLPKRYDFGQEGVWITTPQEHRQRPTHEEARTP